MKRLTMLCLCLCLALSFAAAEPIPLKEEYTGDTVRYYDEGAPEKGRFEFSYRYPHVDPEAEGAEDIDLFYTDLINYHESFDIPMGLGGLGSSDDITEITYEITCNNDNFFSVLTCTSRLSDGFTTVFYEGHVFSRKNSTPGTTFSLPRFLGTLTTDESDTWLQDRQTAKANEAVLDLVWEQIEDNEAEIDYYPELTRELLSGVFFPEEDYFLDENGNPVFFLQPGSAAPEEAGLLRFPVDLEDILDEI